MKRRLVLAAGSTALAAPALLHAQSGAWRTGRLHHQPIAFQRPRCALQGSGVIGIRQQQHPGATGVGGGLQVRHQVGCGDTDAIKQGTRCRVHGHSRGSSRHRYRTG